MSIQDYLSKSLHAVRKRLFDYKVGQAGTESKVIRLKTTKDAYGDQEVEIINNEIITVYLDIPGELPLERLRDDVLTETASTESVFFFDVLPIMGYAKFEDNVEYGDVLIKKIYFDNTSNYKLMVLRVASVLGNIANDRLVWKKFQCAPYNIALPQSVQNLIDDYKDTHED